MLTKDLTVKLVIDPHDADRSAAETHVAHLAEAIGELPVSGIERATVAAPAGTKSGVGLELGAIIVALGASGATLPMLIALVRDWLAGRRGGAITVKIGSDELHLTHVSAQDQRRALEAFLDRHSG